MGVLLWFAPWAVYWVLVGHAPLLIAATVALAVAVAVLLSSREPAARIPAIGAVATFAVLALAPTIGGAQRWVLPLSFAGLFAVVLISRLLGNPVAAAVARADLPAAVEQSELFAPVVDRLTWLWLGALAAMSASALIPPIALPDATLHDTGSALTYLCYWVIPFAILAAVAIGARLVTSRMTAGFGDAVRKTSFVAFVDMEIDQLYYLAQEHANREVGPGQEAYNVTVGAKGTALVGDDTRVSWPSTYKVRQLSR